MKEETVNENIPLVRAGILVIGSGAASLNTALHLKRGGADVIIITEKKDWGASANTGSDKQTYYRADPGSPGGDSYHEMARQLHGGGAMHGDIALIEASLSLYCFHQLAALGVPFPHGTHGNLAGYRTDHDSKKRGASAGPRTSIMMYRCLMEEVEALRIPIYNNHEVIDILKDPQGETCIGVAALDKASLHGESRGLVIFTAQATVFGTGGPAALYGRSVYPLQQKGSLGMAIRAGASTRNLTESQFGIGSVRFRWNLSGSYQQVLPRYFSVDDEGNEYNFLEEFFSSPEAMFLAQFQKGYMWPFDATRCSDEGSSAIDLLVYNETVTKGRKVYLDFRTNPTWRGVLPEGDKLPAEVKEYLEQSDAMGATPYERLLKMNSPACELYQSNGFDLEKVPLEIAVNHQHCNGGISGDIWWESTLHNFFPVGEASGTHGVYRPGGSALNSGQAGGVRASQQILWRLRGGEKVKEVKASFLEKYADVFFERTTGLLGAEKKRDLVADRKEIRHRADTCLGILRNREGVESALKENSSMMARYEEEGISCIEELSYYLKNEDLLVTERTMLAAAGETIKKLKKGRGSWLVALPEDIFGNGKVEMPELSRDDDMVLGEILETRLNVTGLLEHQWVPARPVPENEEWFEELWARFREGTVYKDQ